MPGLQYNSINQPLQGGSRPLCSLQSSRMTLRQAENNQKQLVLASQLSLCRTVRGDVSSLSRLTVHSGGSPLCVSSRLPHLSDPSFYLYKTAPETR